jgi:hypothetical protein
MNTAVKVALITVGVAVPAFFLGPVLFPAADLGIEPNAIQLPFFLSLAVGDALLLGLGVAFLLFGFPAVRRAAPGSRRRAWAMYLSIGYLMVSWWPHLNLHNSNGFNLNGLLAIDLAFHLPLEIAGGVLAYCFTTMLLAQRRGRGSKGLRDMGLLAGD